MNSVTLMDLRPGDIGFGPIGGLIGLGVGIGQVVMGDESRFRHVMVVTRAADIRIEGPVARRTYPRGVEAMPSGAREVSLADRWNERYVYIRLEAYPQEVRDQIAYHARQMIGTPYSFADYPALGLKRVGVEWEWLDEWISREDERGYPARAICSQLADAACTKAGIQVFNDGRLSQDVIPGALFDRMLRIGGRALWPA